MAVVVAIPITVVAPCIRRRYRARYRNARLVACATLFESLAGAASQIRRGIWWSARLRLTTAIGLLPQFGLLPFRWGTITLRPRIRLLASRLSTASAIAIAWLGAAFSTTSATLTLSSTATTAVTAALVSSALVSSAASTPTRARLAARGPLPLSALG